MNSLMLVGVIACIVLLVIIQAVHVPRSRYSDFELRRRQKTGDPQAVFGLKRQAARGTIIGLQQILTWLVLIVLAVLLYVSYGVVGAIAYGLLSIVLVGLVSIRGPARRIAQKVYRRIELVVVEFCLRHQKILSFVVPPLDGSAPLSPIDSRQELRHVIDGAKNIISSEEHETMLRSLDFYGHTVAEIMVPREDMMTIGTSELLGPLVLSDLHKTGHTIFPVENNGDIVGMLNISDHAALRSKESVIVRDVMHNDVIKIDQAETLDEALKLLIAVKQPYLIVTDEDAVVGLIGLGDVVRTLTGWKRR